MTLNRRLEIIGLILLLFSFGLECISIDLKYNKIEDFLSAINHKIDLLWENELANFSKNNTTDMAMGVDIDSVNKYWEPHEKFRKNYVKANDQIGICDLIQILLYVIGSSLIIMSKCIIDEEGKERL